MQCNGMQRCKTCIWWAWPACEHSISACEAPGGQVVIISQQTWHTGDTCNPEPVQHMGSIPQIMAACSFSWAMCGQLPHHVVALRCCALQLAALHLLQFADYFSCTHREAQGLKQQLVSQHVHGQLLIAEAVDAGGAGT